MVGKSAGDASSWPADLPLSERSYPPLACGTNPKTPNPDGTTYEMEDEEL